jgi:hypothetical protein
MSGLYCRGVVIRDKMAVNYSLEGGYSVLFQRIESLDISTQSKQKNDASKFEVLGDFRCVML